MPATSGATSEAKSGVAVLRVGQPFNPFGLFYGAYIPEALVKTKIISPGAKLVYGRLTRYAGEDGECYPAVPTLASEIGLSVRQTQKYLAELERVELIRRVARISNAGQSSNFYVFLFHLVFAGRLKNPAGEGVTDAAPGGVTHPSPEGVTYSTPKDSQIEESHSEETNIDLDSPASNRKKRDSRLDAGDARSTCKQHPRVREALAEYMVTDADTERVYPTDRQVVDVMDAAGGASEEDVVRCLHYLREERGLRPGTRNGPRRFGWFKTVAADYFLQKAHREMVFKPAEVDWDRRNGPGLSKAEFDSMTDAIEVEGI